MIFNREPALIMGLVTALVALGVGFGLDIDAEQQALILAAVVALLSVITRQVVSPASVVTEEEAQLREQAAAQAAYRDIRANDA